MAQLLGILLVSFIIHAVAVVPFINLLYRAKFFKKKTAVSADKTDAASTHIRSKSRTPEGGGLLIILITSLIFAVLFPLLKIAGVNITHVYPINEEINVIFFTFLSFGALGLYDDIVKYFELDRDLGYAGLKTRNKFLIQAVLGLIVGSLLYFNLHLSIINVPFIGVLNFGYWFIPIAAFLVMTFANAVNITDGMDGLAGGLLMIALFGFLILSTSILDTPISIFIALWLGGLIAFLYFNVFPARIFMGDAGAMAFGATLAVIGLLLGKFVALLVIGIPFLIDGLSSLLQIASVRLTGRRILPIAPIHYWLLRIGWTEPKIVQRAWLAGIMVVIFGLWLALI
jgi:phospho-N-acetylmuramoyl-pentapeptide-transferase